MEILSNNQIEEIRNNTAHELSSIMNKLNDNHPDAAEGLATALGAGTGAAGSFTALVFAGTTGLSAAGITSGLAAAGAVVGGGMAAGIGVLAAPIAVLGIGGYALAKKRKNAKLAAALSEAISNLYTIQERLMQNAEYFKEELAMIKTSLDYIMSRQK